MKRAFIHANIWRNEHDAFLVEDGRFSKIGASDELIKELGAEDETVDLNGAFVTPGFIDSHMHLYEYGHYLRNVPLLDCTSKEQVIERLKQRLKMLEAGEWLVARGYNEEQFDVPGMITKQDLDAVSRDVPIAVTRCYGHKMAVNSKALELANMEEDSMVEGGSIDFEKGLLEETAITVLHACWPKESAETMRKSVLHAQKELNRFGITSVGSDDFLSVGDDWRMVLDQFMKMAYKGELTVRVNEQCEFPNPEEYAAFLDEGYTADVGDDLFRIGPLKLITDGSLGARTAAMSMPYSDDPSTLGIAVYKRPEIETWVKLASEYNMPVIAHAIGDEAVKNVLDVFDDYVLPGNPLHSGLVHCQIMTNEEIERVKAMNLSCYFQSLFIDTDAPILEARVGKERAETSYPFGTLYRSVTASNGSDAPVETPDVLKGIQLAVTRTTLDGAYAMNQSECLTVEEALESYTSAGAKNFFADDRYGKIEVGYYADFVVLDEDITAIDVNRIKDTKILMTVMNGETVFER
ncbi:MAG: amidohydrolase [Solobacterium sp.]|nr:amidohydrolase [Solobacterium sp.]